MMRCTVFLISLLFFFDVDAQDLFSAASIKHSTPPELLYSIALQESGKVIGGQYKPRAWTLNVCGKGIHFNTKDEALLFLKEAIDVSCSVDIGIMQIHWQSHHEKFKNYEEALDPIKNIDVGAQILKDQYIRVNDWYEATGRYHSPGNKRLASIYRDKVFKILKKEFK